MLSWRSLSGPQNYGVKTYGAGVTAGYLAVHNNVWDIVPALALSFENRDTNLEGYTAGIVPLPPYWRPYCCGREAISMLGLGIGLGFTGQVTLLPSVAFPLGANGETTYTARAVLRLGNGR